MNRLTGEELGVGPELDAAVGRRIGAPPPIRWIASIPHDFGFDEPISYTFWDEDAAQDFVREYGGELGHQEMECPPYSTDNGVAVEALLPWLDEQGYTTSLDMSAEEVCCEIFKDEAAGPLARCTAPTLGEALCRAVLRLPEGEQG